MCCNQNRFSNSCDSHSCQTNRCCSNRWTMNSGCSNCSNGCGCGRCNSCMNSCNPCCPRPIVAPKRVCTTCRNQYVEQPVICPIECRRVNNIVYYPRYYPRYEETCYTQDNNSNFF